MHISLLLSCFLLAATEYFLGYAHMIPDERLSTNRVAASNALAQNLEINSPPVVIVGKFERTLQTVVFTVLMIMYHLC